PVDDGLDNRQAQAAARRNLGPGAGLVDLVEPIEHARQLIFGDARAGVFDGDHDPGAVAIDRDVDAAAGRRVADGVGDEILQRLLDSGAIAPDRRYVGGGSRGKRDAPLFDDALVALAYALEQRLDGDALVAERRAPSLESGQIEQVTHNLLEPFRLVGHDPQ